MLKYLTNILNNLSPENVANNFLNLEKDLMSGKNISDLKTRELILKICLYHWFKDSIKPTSTTKKVNIEICESAIAEVSIGQDVLFDTCADYYFIIKLKIHNIKVYKGFYTIDDCAEPTLEDIYDDSNSRTPKASKSALLNFLNQVSIDEEKCNEDLKLPDWFKKEVQRKWQQIEYTLTNEFEKENQLIINERFYDPSQEKNLNKKRLFLLLSKTLESVLTEEELESIDTVCPQIQKQCLVLLKDILETLNYDVSENEIKSIISEATHKLEYKNNQ